MKQLITVTLIAVVSFIGVRAGAQGMAVNTTGSAADNSAMLDVSSTTKGALMPRMDSAQRVAILSPATGLLVYQTNGATPGFYYYSGSAWTALSGTGGSSSGSTSTTVSGSLMFYGTFTSGITLSQSLSGSPAPVTIVWNADSVNTGTAMNTSTGVFTAPSAGYYLVDAQVLITAGGSGTVFVSLQVGSTINYFGQYGGNTNVYTTGDAIGSLYGTLSHVVYLNAGTTMKVRLATNTSGGLTTQSGLPGNYLSITKL
jgi:hypothetical protein